MCAHPKEKVRFLSCTAADRLKEGSNGHGLPGMWVCDDCGEKFSKDPNNPNSVKYLPEPNPANYKSFPLIFPKQKS